MSRERSVVRRRDDGSSAWRTEYVADSASDGSPFKRTGCDPSRGAIVPCPEEGVPPPAASPNRAGHLGHSRPSCLGFAGVVDYGIATLSSSTLPLSKGAGVSLLKRCLFEWLRNRQLRPERRAPLCVEMVGGVSCLS